MIWSLLLSAALAGSPVSHDLSWDLLLEGLPIGKRTLTVKFVPAERGMLRILESWTEIDGNVGPIKVQYKQRLTAHASGEPGSFHAVIEQNGTPREVQGRYTPSGWWVTIAEGGRSRTYDTEPNRIQLSTADLFDPESRVMLSRFEKVRMLSAETGDTWEGPIRALGASEVEVSDGVVPVQGYAWTGPQGDSEFYFSDEGYLVRYKMKLLGLGMEGVLSQKPPGGIDEFSVSLGRATIEELDL